jgi:hypothetical protein
MFVPFPIKTPTTSPNISHLDTVELWYRFAPPKTTKHWRSGRSAMEMAKAWRGGMPPEVQNVLGATPLAAFVPEVGCPEDQTRFDQYAQPRRHDLLIRGRVGAEPSLLDVEGKADETFGPRVGAVSAVGTAGQKLRVEALSQAVFGCPATDPSVAGLRYQLLYGTFATAHLAKQERRNTAVFLVHEFQNDTCSAARLQANADHLNAFLLRIALPPITQGVHAVGPVPNSSWVQGVQLWIAKAVSWQAPVPP